MLNNPQSCNGDAQDASALQDLAIRLSGIGTFDWDISTGQIKHQGFQREMFALNEIQPCQADQWLLPWLHPDDMQGAIQVLATIAAANEACSIGFCARYLLPAGSCVWIQLKAEVDFLDREIEPSHKRLRGTLEDVSLEQKQASLYETILESIGDGFVSFDDAWRYTYVNKKAEILLGRLAHQLIGQVFWDVFPEVHGSALETAFRTAMAGSPTCHEYYYLPWGRWFANYCAPKFGGGLTVYFQDVTSRRAEEQERALVNGRSVLEQINVAAQTLAALAHELNQPLMVLQANNVSLNHLLKRAGMSEEVRTILDESEFQAQRASSIFRGLVQSINTWRHGNSVDARYDAHAVLEGCVRNMISRFPNVTIHLDLRAQSSMLYGDQIQVEKSLMNLFTNAAEACCSHEGSNHAISVITSSSVELLSIRVIDSGHGLSEAVQKHLFTEFTSTKRFGLGLGLCISKSLIEAQGGRLWFHGNLNPGAEFRLNLPLAP